MRDLEQPRPVSRGRNTGFTKERSWVLPLDEDPRLPAPYDNADLAAFKAMRDGQAQPYQQKLVLDWILYACGTYENAYRKGGADGARATDFASGKQWIGQQVVKLLNMPALAREQGEQG